METRRMFIVGGSGFIGTETIREAVTQGWSVTAVVRSEEKADRLRSLGALTVIGDAARPREWIGSVCGADVFIDLVQPELPARITPRHIAAVSVLRQTMTRETLASLLDLPVEERPLVVSVSGTDDLAPDPRGRIEAGSPLRALPVGFGQVGAPVRRLVEGSGIPATFLYLGTVYGPGKSFAATIFPRLVHGRMLLPNHADNFLPLIHVRDAARAIVHLAGLGQDHLVGRSWILVDEAGGARLEDFFERAAGLLGVAPPRRVPGWLLSVLLGHVLYETLTRDIAAEPSGLLATGFRFAYPTIREGLPATLSALGYPLSDGPMQKDSHRAVGWWALLGLTLTALVAVNALDFPLSLPHLRGLARGTTILDMRMGGYTTYEVQRLLEAFGPDGRRSYLEMLWTIDLLLPAIFTIFLWESLSLGALRKWRWMALLAGGADYVENVSISFLLVAFPVRHDSVVTLASILTVSKFFLYFITLAFVATGAIVERVNHYRVLAVRNRISE